MTEVKNEKSNEETKKEVHKAVVNESKSISSKSLSPKRSNNFYGISLLSHAIYISIISFLVFFIYNDKKFIFSIIDKYKSNKIDKAVYDFEFKRSTEDPKSNIVSYFLNILIQTLYLNISFYESSIVFRLAS